MDGILIAPLARILAGYPVWVLSTNATQRKAVKNAPTMQAPMKPRHPTLAPLYSTSPALRSGRPWLPTRQATQASALKNIEKPAAVAAAFSSLANPAATVGVIPARMANT